MTENQTVATTDGTDLSVGTISDVFSIDPRELTRDQKDRIIEKLRERHKQFLDAGQKVTPEMKGEDQRKMSLDDLGIDIDEISVPEGKS